MQSPYQGFLPAANLLFEHDLEGIIRATSGKPFFVRGVGDWHPFHGPKNLFKLIAIEASELMERFQWLTAEEARAAVKDPVDRAAVADELADADYAVVVGIIHCLSLSNILDLDISSAVLGKLQTNEHWYPGHPTGASDEFHGRFRRPERKKEAEG
jgi:dCTP diphosphatase